MSTRAKIHILKDGKGDEHVLFMCPGCNRSHVVPIQRSKPVDPQHWFFNANMDKPTLEPSLRVFKLDGKETACHLILTDGVINYCADSSHKYAGKVVGMLTFEWPPPDDD